MNKRKQINSTATRKGNSNHQQTADSTVEVSDFWAQMDNKPTLVSTESSDATSGDNKPKASRHLNQTPPQKKRAHVASSPEELLSSDLLAAISSPQASFQRHLDDPVDMLFSDDAFSTDKVEQTPPLFMQPIIRKAVSSVKHNVLIVTDFTFPKFGGVETHGYQLG